MQAAQKPSRWKDMATTTGRFEYGLRKQKRAWHGKCGEPVDCWSVNECCVQRSQVQGEAQSSRRSAQHEPDQPFGPTLPLRSICDRSRQSSSCAGVSEKHIKTGFSAPALSSARIQRSLTHPSSPDEVPLSTRKATVAHRLQMCVLQRTPSIVAQVLKRKKDGAPWNSGG